MLCAMTIYEYDLKEILPRLKGPLRELLELELARGNSMTEISESWPMQQANVWLARRFHVDYRARFPSLKYRYLGDPRNWIEEYVNEELSLMVAVAG